MKVFAEYIWLGGNNEIRSKLRVMDFDNISLNINDYPEWNYDGSSCNQADGNNSEVFIRPVFVCINPLEENSVCVLCATYDYRGVSLPNNNWEFCNKAMIEFGDENPWFGLEQEYFIMDLKTGLPIGMPINGHQGQYYCSNGGANAFGRKIVMEHLKVCVDAGLKISGINSEVAVGQWEFQVGIAKGMEGPNHLWMARFFMERISEKYNVRIDWNPKPVKGNWNGSGCHCNFSTEAMRNEGGYDVILDACKKMKETHMEHMFQYGEGNEERMTGIHETASYSDFNWGVANRGASVRIGNDVLMNQKGYFEDRRPSSNCDPYLVCGLLVRTCCS